MHAKDVTHGGDSSVSQDSEPDVQKAPAAAETNLIVVKDQEQADQDEGEVEGQAEGNGPEKPEGGKPSAPLVVPLT